MKNNFWKQTFVFGFGFMLLRGISFFLLPIYTNFLSTFDAGFIFLIYTILAFLNPVFSYGMNASLFKFYNNKHFSEKSVLSTSFISLLISSFGFGFVLLLMSSQLNIILISHSYLQVNWFFYIALILFADSFSSRVFVVLRLKEQPKYFLLVGLINILFSLSFNFLFIRYFNLASFGAVLALLLVSLMQMICLLPVIINSVRLRFFEKNLLKQMLRFAVPFLPSALLFVIIGFSDRWFIKFFLGVESVGLYGAGYKLGSIMSLIVTGFNLNWQPYYLKQKNNKYHQFGGIGSMAIIGFVMVGVVIICFSSNLAQINYQQNYLIGEEFWPGLAVVPYITLGYLFYGIYILQMPSLFLLNKQNWGLLFWLLGAFVNVAGNWFLIPNYGILGASFATALGYFTMMICIILKNKTWLPIYYRNTYLFIYIALSLVILVIRPLGLIDNSQMFLFLFVVYLLVGTLFIIKIKSTLFQNNNE